MLGNLLLILTGFFLGMAAMFLWYGLRFLADLRETRRATAADIFFEAPGERDQAALAAVDACKNRLRWHRDPNPEWLTPLVREIPLLVREIAAIYHPEAPNPLLGPDLSQFSRAVQLASTDITEFLQTRTIGRLVDVSAHTAIRTWEKGRDVIQTNTVKVFNKWYRRVLPFWQVLRFKSPLVWAGMAVSNVAARTLQPAIVDIVARRVIELYSGRICMGPRAVDEETPKLK